MIYCGILAGGVGKRMGADRPKQFVELAGKPILLHTLDNFIDSAVIDTIYIAVVEQWLNYAESLIDSYLYEKRSNANVKIITGGADRTDSILKVIAAVKSDGGSDNDILVTHDAARPFTPCKCISESIRGAAACGCCTLAVPSTDTLLRVKDSAVLDAPERSEFFCAQTPQTFIIGSFLHCLDLLSPEERAQVTDACGVFLRAGHRVTVTAGDSANIKLTTPADMEFAKAIIESATQVK